MLAKKELSGNAFYNKLLSVPEYSRMILQQHNGLKLEQMILCQEERTMTKLDFTIPFSGFASTTFINCFTSVYMYLGRA